MLELDGSHGEGGGQIIRTALALSTLTGRPFRVTNIRKNRPQPGLKAQHLTALTALKEWCGAKSSGVAVGTEEFWYEPGAIRGGRFSFDVGTAGSITLVLQALLLPALFAPKKTAITLTGGTCGKWQAPVEYFQNVLLPHLQRFASVGCRLLKRGYYPKGGGQVVVEVTPRLPLKDFESFEAFAGQLGKTTRPFGLNTQGGLMQLKGISHASRDLASAKVAERQAGAARLELMKLKAPVDVVSEYDEAPSIGSGITLWARFNRDDEFHTILGADVLGERGKRAEDVGKEAAAALLRTIDSGAAVDAHLADQLLPFMALLPGSVLSAEEITEHCRTNLWVIGQFLPVRFLVEGTTVSVKAAHE